MTNFFSPQMVIILDRLNDFCLRKVFEFLHLKDLSNTAEVCVRFKRNAEEVFKSKFTNVDIRKMLECDDDYHKEWFMVRWLSAKFIKSVEHLFRNFGRFIEALRVTGRGEGDGMDENELLTLVKTYCSSLKELTLYEMGRDDDFSTELRPLFARLEKLTVSNGYVDVCDSFVAILSDCRDLKQLHVWGPATIWMNHKFPKLETFVIVNNWEFDYTEFESFLESHENLRTLRYDDRDIMSQFFAMMSRRLPKLESFSCNVAGVDDDDEEEEDENILQLSKLQSLRNLTFTCELDSLKRLVDALEKDNTPIEVFEIVDCQIDRELIHGLSKLKSMKTLKLTRCEILEETLINLTKHLSKRVAVIIDDIKALNSSKTLVRNVPKRESENYATILKVLNDDCLMAIFELLPLPDLCNVADVCQRFKQNAQTTFKLHHSRFVTNEITKKDVNGSDYTDVQVAEQLFRNFGFFIRELVLKGRYCRNGKDQETILYLANKYCISLEFDTLTLDGINIDSPMRWLFPLLDLFQLVSKLELYSCRLNSDFGKFLSCCPIRTIQVYCPYGSTEWMNQTFRYVRNFILVDTWQPESEIIEFIKLNGHLQALSIHRSSVSSQIFETVANHMPELRGFCFTGKNPRDRKTRKNVMHLAKLRSLTNLALNCGDFSVKHLLDEFERETVPIADLNISFGSADSELIYRLSRFKSLKSLHLRRVKMNQVSLIDFVKKLPELNQLYIDIQDTDVNYIIKVLPFAKNLTNLTIGSERSNVQIDIDNFKTILEIVKKREKAIKLCITINSERRHVFVPLHLLQESSYWLKIENDIISNLHLVISDSESELEDSDSSVEDSDDNSVDSDDDRSDFEVEIEK